MISKGAQLSGTVNNLLIEKKIIDGKKINVLPKKTPIVKEAPAEEVKAEAPKSEVKAEEAAPAVEEVVEAPVEAVPEVVAEAPVETPATEETPAA